MEKYKSTHTIVSPRFTKFFASGVIVIGLLVLIGWYSKLMFLTRFSIDEVPMAPSTAYIFIYLAVGLWFYLRPQKIAINRNVAIVFTLIVICLSCLLVITNLFKSYANWEHLFIKIPESQLSMQLGHMSLVTALLFIISGFALLFLLSNREIVKTFSIILTLILFIISFILLLGYAFGTPFFYFDSFIPPAVLTVLSFLLVSLALIAASDKKTFFVKTIMGANTSARLLRIFLPTTIAITVIESLIVIRILPLLNIHPAIGVSLVSLIVVAVVVIVISIISKSMGKSLDSTIENLNISEERFRMISENAPVLINSFDKDGRCLFWNKECSKTFGWTIEEINEHDSAMALFYPDPAVLEEVIRAVTSDPDGNFREWHPVAKDGKILSIMWANFSLPNGQIFSMGHDITERKQAEENLRESDKFSKKIIEAMSDGFSILNEIGVHIDVNLAFCKMTGFAKEELIGVGPPHPYWPEEEYENIQEAFVKTAQGNFESFELVFKNKNGKRFPVLVNPSQIKDDQGNVISNFATVMDITKRKKAEERIRFQANLLETVGQAVIVTNPLGIINYWNPYAEKLYNWTSEEVIGRNIAEITVPQLSQDQASDIMAQIGSGKNWSGEFLVQKKNGTTFPAYVSNTPILNTKGELKAIIGISTDITEQKQAEEGRKKNQILLQQAEEVANQGAWEWDIIQDEWMFSKNWLRVHGCRLSGITRDELMTLAYPEDAPKVEKAFQNALKGGRPYKIEHRIIRQNDGELRYVRALGNLILNDSGQPIKMYGVAQDITEHKQAEQELKESEENLNALFTSLTEIVVMHELVLNAAGEAIDYRIVDCNKVFTEFTGIRKEDAIDKLASELYQSIPPPYLEKYAKVALGGDSHEFTTFYQPLDKHLMISVVSPQHGNFATITTDISDMMQIQKTIMAKNKEMENYLYVTSHDLRTPLVNIQGFSQRLKKQADSIKNLFTDKKIEPEILHQLAHITDEDMPKTLQFVLSNIEKMDALINGLLQLSRTGRVDMNIQNIDMNELLAKTLQSLDFQIKEAHCKIHIHPLPECYGDAALLDQLFANIISNALKYADTERALEITVGAKKINNSVVYTIRDNGKGMAQKYLDKIWDVFYRIDPRSGKTGEGIGLSLVKRIADKHKGKVWVASEENQGSEFFIELNNRKFTEI